MTERPNVLCISIDSLRADFTPFVHGPQTTPFLGGFIDEATVFDGAISPSTWTLPVHTSVFTGLYPPEHGVLDRGVTLGDHPTFAEVLAADGYETHSYYRNGWLDVGGIQRGIAHRHRVESTNSPVERFAGVADRVIPTTGEYLTATREALVGTDDDTAVVAKANDRLASAESPFYCFVHLNDAHWPYAPPTPHHSDDGALSVFWNRVYWQERIYRNRERTWAGELSPPEREVALFKHRYRDAVAHVTRLVERLLRTLDDEGVLSETIVVVFGDHGDSFGEGGTFGHHFSVEDAVIRVPLVVFDPTDRLEATRVRRPVNLNDLYPTLLELCGVTPPATRSRSLVSDDPREAAFTYYEYTDELARNANADLGAVSADALRPRKQYAAWAGPDRRATWYPDIDRWEDENEALREVLRRHTDRLTSVEPGSTTDVGDDVLRNLEDMGYVQR